MKIDEKMINLPPYLSTSWRNVCALHMKDNLLVVTLVDGEAVTIPNLAQEVIEKIFISHANFLAAEKQQQKREEAEVTNPKLSSPLSFLNGGSNEADVPFRFGFGGVDGFGSVMQHNPAQANTPDLPHEIVNKIAGIAKIIAPDHLGTIPKAEPHCNCVHCQIARAIHHGLEDSESETTSEEELVSDEELTFEQWDIIQAGKNLFTVVNRLDSKERYSVYLGHPVGCTCGKQGCEHIVAVLKS